MDYEQFKKEVYTLTKIDLNAYKEKQMKRRIDSLIAKHKIADYKEYIEAIRPKTEKFEEFVNFLTINVSEFYRNPEQWKALETEILPMLLDNNNGTIRIWSAACSTGDEPYSLAMVLADLVPLSRVKIMATDIDKQVLEKAKVGLYGEKSLAGLPIKYKNKYFTKVGTSNYQICDEIKRTIEFRQHNLLLDSYPDRMDLIVCRNVLIYFTEEAKDGIYRKFYQSLVPKGVLFVGSTEQIIQYRSLNFTSMRSFFYQKP